MQIPTEIGVAVISAIATLLAVLLPLLFSIRKHTRAAADDARVAREEVRNNHYNANGEPINFRDEQDERHDFLVTLLTGLQSDVRGLRKESGRIQDRFEKHLEHNDEIVKRVESLEKTVIKFKP